VPDERIPSVVEFLLQLQREWIRFVTKVDLNRSELGETERQFIDQMEDRIFKLLQQLTDPPTPGKN
jgi:hypothetical protein